MRQVIGRLVEQHLPQPAAQHHAEHAVEQQVVERGGVDAVPGLRRCTPATEQQEGDEAGQVHQPIPAHRQRAKAQGNGIELRMNEHVAAENLYG